MRLRTYQASEHASKSNKSLHSKPRISALCRSVLSPRSESEPGAQSPQPARSGQNRSKSLMGNPTLAVQGHGAAQSLARQPKDGGRCQTLQFCNKYFAHRTHLATLTRLIQSRTSEVAQALTMSTEIPVPPSCPRTSGRTGHRRRSTSGKRAADGSIDQRCGRIDYRWRERGRLLRAQSGATGSVRLLSTSLTSTSA